MGVTMASSYITLFLFVAPLLFVTVLTSGGATKFDYSQVKKWGTLDSKYATCSIGKKQSPLDINTSQTIVDQTLKPLTRMYHVYNASLHSNGLDVEVKFNVNGGLILDGKKYDLKQMHWHTPSEHRFNGIKYAAELHQVHVDEDGNRAVIGILLREGPPDPILTMLKLQLDELAKNPCQERLVAIPKFDSRFLQKRPRNYYKYHGSLTTPPCDENVIWNVLAKVKTISKEQVAALKAPACAINKNNARPTQPLNKRTLTKYQEN